MSKKNPAPQEDRVKVPGPGAYELDVDQIKRGNPQYK